MRFEKTIMGLKYVATTGRYSGEEIAQRGEEIYSRLRSQVDPGNEGRIFAVDIDSGEYEITDRPEEASDRLFDRLNDPQIYCLRIGYDSVYSFDGKPRRLAS